MKGTEGIPDVAGWGMTPKEAVTLQRELAPRVRIEPLRREIRTVAAVDVSIRNRIATGAIVVVDISTGEVIEAHSHTAPAAFPYVPGLLSFREIPALMPVIDALSALPDVFMCDGQGIAHPRRFGLASHLGVLLDTSSFGVAKKKFVGTYAEPSLERGSVSPLMDGGDEIGAVLRTRAGVKPVFVSAGHLIDLPTSLELTLRLTSRFRMPDPARMAHRLSKDGVSPVGS
jgi:deoxyribonuclease V